MVSQSHPTIFPVFLSVNWNRVLSWQVTAGITGAELGTEVGEPVTIGTIPVGEEVGGAKHLLLPMSRVVPSGQTHPSLLALCSKVFSQTHKAEPSTTVHTPALLQVLFLHGSG